jgi:hypothetical protein
MSEDAPVNTGAAWWPGEGPAYYELELRGPVGGYFVWEPGDGGPLMLLAGGSGIVPLRSILRHRRRTGSDGSPCRWASRTGSPCDGGVGRIFTGGTGSGTYVPVSGQESVPNAFEGVNNVILTAGRQFLEATWSRLDTGLRSGEA